MTPVPVLSHGPELFVYTFEGAAASAVSDQLLWPLIYVVDRMQEWRKRLSSQNVLSCSSGKIATA